MLKFKIMKKIFFLITIVLSLFCIGPVNAARISGSDSTGSKTIVIAGSSVATGWVTSYKEKYDMQNGYAARLARQLASEGWTVINKSRPGFTTADVLASFDKYIEPRPDILFIGLSMANEGLTSDNPDSVLNRFSNGLLKILSMCNQKGIQPVVGLCYANNDYSPLHYDYIRRMNATINSWQVPCINFLGSLNNGQGHFPEGYTFDAGHPDNRGHEELFLAIPPSLFDALMTGKKVPEMSRFRTPELFTSKVLNSNVMYVPSDVVHSFAFSFCARASRPATLATIVHTQGVFTLLVNSRGKAALEENNKVVFESKGVVLDGLHHFLINHNYLNRQIEWWIDGELAFAQHEQMEPICFEVHTSDKHTDIRNFLIYRASLHADEIMTVATGVPPLASLEYAALANNPSEGWPISANQAAATCEATLDTEVKNERIGTLKQKMAAAHVARQSEPFFPPKKPIAATPGLYGRFAGKYQIAENDFFVITLDQSKLYMEDRGNKAELLPESAVKFFIHYPADLTVEFIEDGSGRVTELVFSMNGREMRAKKVP